MPYKVPRARYTTLVLLGVVLAGAPACASAARTIGTSRAAPPFAGPQDGDPLLERRALQAALGLVSLPPGVRAVLVDPDLAPEPEAIRPLDAFVVRERSGSIRLAIYVNRRSDIVREAVAGSILHVLILAAVLHHEAQHVLGASEPDASRAELVFFQSLVARGYIAPEAGLRHLALLTRQTRRPGHRRPADVADGR